MAQKLNELALGYSLAILSVVTMLLLWIAGKIGVYETAVQQMMNWHIFFSLTPSGLIFGAIEAAICSFIGGWLIAKVYNKFA